MIFAQHTKSSTTILFTQTNQIVKIGIQNLSSTKTSPITIHNPLLVSSHLGSHYIGGAGMVFLYDDNSWVLQTGCFPPLTIACSAPPPLMTQLASSHFFGLLVSALHLSPPRWLFSCPPLLLPGVIVIGTLPFRVLHGIKAGRRRVGRFHGSW